MKDIIKNAPLAAGITILLIVIVIIELLIIWIMKG